MAAGNPNAQYGCLISIKAKSKLATAVNAVPITRQQIRREFTWYTEEGNQLTNEIDKTHSPDKDGDNSIAYHPSDEHG